MIAVVSGVSVLEMITRARTHLAIILVDNNDGTTYAELWRYFRNAAEEGLLNEKQLPNPPAHLYLCHYRPTM